MVIFGFGLELEEKASLLDQMRETEWSEKCEQETREADS